MAGNSPVVGTAQGTVGGIKQNRSNSYQSLKPTMHCNLLRIRYFCTQIQQHQASNYTHYNLWDEITYAFLNFNGATVEV